MKELTVLEKLAALKKAYMSAKSYGEALSIAHEINRLEEEIEKIR